MSNFHLSSTRLVRGLQVADHVVPGVFAGKVGFGILQDKRLSLEGGDPFFPYLDDDAGYPKLQGRFDAHAIQKGSDALPAEAGRYHQAVH